MNPATDTDPLISVIVPAYNEQAYIADVLKRVYDLPINVEVIVVDDGSTDSTVNELDKWRKNNGLILLQHESNRGKGAAIRTGISESTGDIVVIQDSDMEYDPADIERLIEPISNGRADVVYGSRLIGGQPQRVHFFWHWVGNKLLTLLTNFLYNRTLSDMETGYKVLSGEIIRDLPLVSNDFRIEPEITAKLLRKNLRIYEMPVAYYGRDYSEGKKITWKDAFPAIWTLVRYRFNKI